MQARLLPLLLIAAAFSAYGFDLNSQYSSAATGALAIGAALPTPAPSDDDDQDKDKDGGKKSD